MKLGGLSNALVALERMGSKARLAERRIVFGVAALISKATENEHGKN